MRRQAPPPPRPARRATPAAFVVAAAVLAGSSALAVPPRIEVHRVVDTGSMPKGVVISPDGRRLYVANYGQLDHRNVGVYDAQTLALVAEIDVPGIVVESAIAPDGATLYVSNFRRNSVQFVDLATRRVTREVTAGQHPKILALSADGRRLFAANWGSRNVTEIDTATGAVVRTLAAEENPRGMALTRAGRLNIANSTSDSIDVYDGAQMEHHHRLPHVCRIPRHLTLAPDEASLYVSCLGAGLLAVMDTATERVTQRVFVSSGPKANDVSPDGRYVATADYNANAVTLIDTTDWRIRTIELPTADRASGIVFARDSLRLFVTGWFDNHVYEVGVAGTAPRFHPSTRELARTRTERVRHDAVSGE